MELFDGRRAWAFSVVRRILEMTQRDVIMGSRDHANDHNFDSILSENVDSILQTGPLRGVLECIPYLVRSHLGRKKSK